MSAPTPQAYRFATQPQWEQCLLHRFDALKDGGLTAAPRLSPKASNAAPAKPGAVSSVAVDIHGEPVWMAGSTHPLWQSPRLVPGRYGIWYFSVGGTWVARVDSDTLTLDLRADAGAPVLDIAGDGQDGVWVLRQDGMLLHFDCDGCPRNRYPAPCELEHPAQIATVSRGSQLVLLAADGKRIAWFETATGKISATKSIVPLAACWHFTILTADSRNRIALWGPQELNKATVWTLFVLDPAGDVVDGPVVPLFTGSAVDLSSARIAIGKESVFLSTNSGLWRLDPEQTGEQEVEGVLLTPALYSPDRGTDRGWLRAEAFIALGKGSTLEAQVAFTDDPRVTAQAESLASDTSSTAQQKQDAIWALFKPEEIASYRFAGPTRKGVPLAIPLIEPKKRWLWLRIAVLSPPDAAPVPLSELRVLYPELSIARNLPAIFQGAQNDPNGTLRRLVGVLESTTQNFDEKIRGIAAFLDPRTTPKEWLNYLARWFDLPWEDELPVESKRRLIAAAGRLLDARGTRRGLTILLAALLGDDARIEIADMTADFAPLRLGQGSATLPGLLAGTSLRTPTLGAKAVLGRARLCAGEDPLAVLAPELRLTLSARPEIRRSVEPLLQRVLADYVPAGVALSIRWRAQGSEPTIGDAGMILDANGPALLGENSSFGRTLVGGRRRVVLDEAGITMG